MAVGLISASMWAGEPYRPLYHFSPARNWTNDPCGLVYFEGRYHLFFQYNPHGDTWGHMSWGHASSTDLVHWQELPVALREENGIMMFTGSAVVDRGNSSGLCAGHECMIAIYTGHKEKLQNQNLAVSDDHGATWKKYSGNPVLDRGVADFRDPKVIWHPPSGQWVMTVLLPQERKALFYGSKNLKSWDLLGEFGPAGSTTGIWECPELFELPVDGDRKNTRWVLKIGVGTGHPGGGSGEQYFVGKFDGKRFVNENPGDRTLWFDYGRDCYCALTWNHQPADQPKAIMGWMNNWEYAKEVPTTPWRGQMTAPRKMALRTFAEGIRLVQEPVDALKGQHGRTLALSGPPAMVNQRIAAFGPGKALDLDVSIDLGSSTTAGFRLRKGTSEEVVIGYDSTRHELFADRTRAGNITFHKQFASVTKAPLESRDGKLKLRILLDSNSVEVFANDGKVAMTNLIFPGEAALGLEFFGNGGPARIMSGTLWEMKPYR
jgi:fructan beta-fructosidase